MEERTKERRRERKKENGRKNKDKIHVHTSGSWVSSSEKHPITICVNYVWADIYSYCCQ